MKKLLFAVLATATLAACTQEELVSINKGDAITFDNAFIDNATRAAIDGTYTTSTLNEFQVYATITTPEGGVANIFEGEKVVKGGTGTGDAWTYDADNTQYWIEGNTYDFRAVADGNVSGVTEAVVNEKGLLTGVNLLDVAAQKDILFAEKMDVDYAGGAQTVKFTFEHLMAKVKFTFKNAVSTDNGYTYKVTNVKINETANNGVYTIGAGWAEAASRVNTSLVFGNATTSDVANAEATEIGFNGSVESNWERLLVPSVEARNITFTTQLFKDDVVIETKQRTINTDPIALEEGSAYNFVISLSNPGEPIKFDVEEVNDWEEENVSIVEVSTTAGLIEALASGKKEVLVKAGSYTFPANKVQAGTTIICEDGVVFNGTSSLNINGATVIGGTFSNPDGMAVSGTVNGTFKDCVFEGEEALRWCYTAAGQTSVFENCAIKTDFRGFHFDGMEGDVIFRNCEINGFNAYGGEGTVTFENCRFGTDNRSSYNGLNTYSNTVLTDCEFIYISGKTNFIDLEGTGRTMTITNCTATLDGAAVDVKDFVGGSKKAENTVIINGKVLASNQADLNDAVAEDNAVIELGAGNYNMPNVGNNVTISGDENTVISVDKPNCTGGDVTFEGVTIKGNGYSTGIQHVNTVTYNNATIVGDMCLYGEKVVFNACTFELAQGQYIWTYGAKEVEFIGCTFNTAGKAILIYNEGSGASNVTVKDCTFNASAGDKAGAIANQNCAAIEIDNYQSSGVGVAHKLTTSGNNHSANFSGEWRIKNYVAGNAITVNGVAYNQIAIDGQLMTKDSSNNVTIQ